MMLMNQFRKAFFGLVSTLICASNLYAADSVDISLCNIEGIGIGSLAEEVRETFGKATRKSKPCNDCIDQPQTGESFDGIQILYISLQTIHIEISSDQYRLVSGIGVGSSVAEVLHEYGEPVITNGQVGTFLIYPITRDSDQTTGHTLVFHVIDDSVAGLKVGPKMSGSVFP